MRKAYKNSQEETCKIVRKLSKFYKNKDVGKKQIKHFL